MESNDLRRKLRGILEAIASGRSCEQILAADRSLSYRDIFHAVAEAPTTFWTRNPSADTRESLSRLIHARRTPARQRSD
jgi:hypothetical protein